MIAGYRRQAGETPAPLKINISAYSAAIFAAAAAVAWWYMPR
jgi:hypothetical protein